MEQHEEVRRSALKPLKPRLLEIETNRPNSTKEWKHWKKTFQNYVAVYETEGVEIDKLQVPTNFLSNKIYEQIDECETYDQAVGVLDDLFIKTPNEVFARHWLATTKQ